MEQGYKIFGKKLAFIIAHPDDESYLAAGTIHRNNQAGGQSFVICATAGERGRAHLSQSLSSEELKQLRQQELAAVGKLLQLHGLTQLGLPDGQVKQYRPDLTALIEAKMKDTRPDYIFSFGSDGITGHEDHIAVGLAAQQVAQQLTLPFLAFCRPAAVSPALLKQRRRFGVYQEDIKRQEPNLIFEIDPQIKLAALRCHASQMEQADPLGDFPQEAKDELLHREYFYAERLTQNRGKSQS